MILTYHEITSEPSRYLYSVSRTQLDAHLAVVAELQHDGGSGSSCQVTFDDGHRSNYLLGVDLLERHSIRATFFVTAGWMARRDGFMSWRDLADLVRVGHHVQAHGWSHRVLPECSAAELDEELGRAKCTIEDQLGVAVDALSMPHGRWDDRVLRACASAGYRRVYISNPWTQSRQREGIAIVGRYMVRRSMDDTHLRRLLTGDRRLVLLLQSQYRTKEILKYVVGGSTYHRLWSLWAASDDAERLG